MYMYKIKIIISFRSSIHLILYFDFYGNFCKKPSSKVIPNGNFTSSSSPA